MPWPSRFVRRVCCVHAHACRSCRPASVRRACGPSAAAQMDARAVGAFAAEHHCLLHKAVRAAPAVRSQEGLAAGGVGSKLGRAIRSEQFPTGPVLQDRARGGRFPGVGAGPGHRGMRMVATLDSMLAAYRQSAARHHLDWPLADEGGRTRNLSREAESRSRRGGPSGVRPVTACCCR